MDVLFKIKQMDKDFKPSEKKIADFVATSPTEALNMSITELAQVCKVSEASVTRFCKTLEYKGYKEFTITLAQSIEENKESRLQKFHATIGCFDTTNELIEQVTETTVDTVLNLQKTIDGKQVESAIEAINTAHKVVVFAVGTSAVIGLDVKTKLTRIGITTLFNADSHMQLTLACTMGPEDVAIIVSSSGRTKEIIECLDVLSANNIRTIAITQYGSSPLAESGGIIIHTPNVEDTFKNGSTSSRLAQLTAFDIIYNGYTSKYHDEIIQYLDKTRNCLNIRRT